ncbi:MAG: CbiX/SirB N-terminal domain-containing protein [Cyanobacteria bacterium P01_A01_bin.37]
MHEHIAYFFVYHGSRDTRSALSAQRLAQRIVQALTVSQVSPSKNGDKDTAFAHPDNIVFRVGALELATTPLHEQIAEFGHHIARRGMTVMAVLPLFLLAGAHVRDDVPEAVALAQQMLGSSVQLVLRSHVGNHPRIADWLDNQLPTTQNPTIQTMRIFVSHGSKKIGGNQVTEAIAHQLGAITAYWSLSPSLEQCLDDLSAEFKTGAPQSITIIPYFLFSGKITDAIAHVVEQYRHQYSTVHFHVASLIGESDTIVPLFAEWVADPPNLGINTVLA